MTPEQRAELWNAIRTIHPIDLDTPVPEHPPEDEGEFWYVVASLSVERLLQTNASGFVTLHDAMNRFLYELLMGSADDELN